MNAYKILFNTILLLVVFGAIFLFGFSDSYKLSLEAKVKYISGDYIQARILAKEAFDLDPYNRMAISILSQSKISAEMADYIKDGKNYFAKIENLTKKENFSHRDKVKIKMICEVMIGRFSKLNPTVLTDKELFATCKRTYQNFKTINEKLFEKKM